MGFSDKLVLDKTRSLCVRVHAIGQRAHPVDLREVRHDKKPGNDFHSRDGSGGGQVSRGSGH